jgi:hypothetical protein
LARKGYVMPVTACLKLLMLPAVLIGALAMKDSVAAQDRLPDGDVAKLHHNGTTYAAWYGTPTDRYGHAILGDGIEGGSLHLKVGGKAYAVTLPQDQVFEDRTPRIVDLNGDGQPEIVTIRAFLSAGASVAVFGLQGDQLVELASSRPIGQDEPLAQHCRDRGLSRDRTKADCVRRNAAHWRNFANRTLARK